MPVGWKLNLYDHFDLLTTTQGHLAPIELTFDFNLGEASTMSCGISLRDERYIRHDWISPFEDDFKLIINDGITYNDQVLMEGIITHHELDAEVELSNIAGEDYLGYFDRRGYPQDLVNTDLFQREWSALDVSDIVEGVIGVVLAQDFTQLDLVLDIPTLGYIDTLLIPYFDTTPLRGFVDRFAKGYPGFDYRMQYPKTFKVYPIEYDVTQTAIFNFVEDSDGALPGVTSGPKFANSGPGGTHALGGGAGMATEFYQNYAYEPSEQRYRRLDIYPNFGYLVNRSHIRRATAGSLGIALAPIYEVTMTVDPDFIHTTNGFWNDFVPGAYVFIRKDLKAHLLDGLYKIVQMQCTVNTEGQASVTLNMNRATDQSLVFSVTTP